MPKRFTNKKRVHFGLVALFLLAVSLPIALFASKHIADVRQSAAEGDKPNIVVIMTDDQRWDTLDYMPVVKNDLGSRAVTFTHAFATTPWCCPSRSSFLTGEYAHNHGVWTNEPPNGGFQKFDDASTLATWLQAAGYKTALFGKYLNGYEGKKYVPPGWDRWEAAGNNISYYDSVFNVNGKLKKYNGKNQYLTDFLTERVKNFITTTEEPFFVFLSHKAPHGESDPKDIGLDNPDPAKRHIGSCNDLAQHRPPSFNESDMSDKPSWISNKKKVVPRDIDAFRRAQICSLKSVDEGVAELLDTLDSTGKRQNTVVIFTSDNGYAWGEHRYDTKNCLYDECTRVPLIISYPPITQVPQTSDAFALNIDLAPTILSLAGIAIPDTVDGNSLVPLLRDTNTSVRDGVLLEVQDHGRNYGIRTNEYMYAEYATGEKELYDLGIDQYELDNQINNPTYIDTIADLAGQLQQLKQE